MLKEMNRNSNNHAATQIFEGLGGAGKLKEFMRSSLNLGEEHLRFVNGSGNRLETVYNQATCRTIMKVTQALQQELKAQDRGLEHVLPVAGRAHAAEPSTTMDPYLSDKTDGVLIAKTGTVAPAVTLAGLYLTSEGPLYFAYVVKTTESMELWQKAREAIRDHLLRQLSGRSPAPAVEFTPEPFSEFDSESWRSSSPE